VTSAEREHWQGRLPDPAWEPAGLCEVRSRPQTAGESQELLGWSRVGGGPGSSPTVPGWGDVSKETGAGGQEQSRAEKSAAKPRQHRWAAGSRRASGAVFVGRWEGTDLCAIGVPTRARADPVPIRQPHPATTSQDKDSIIVSWPAFLGIRVHAAISSEGMLAMGAGKERDPE
jgi:hypothetical protein